MTVERIAVPAIRFIDETGATRTMVPLLDEDGAWFVLDESGCSYWRTAQDVRDLAQTLRDDFAGEPDRIRETCAAYDALAELIDQVAP